jgi:hypothetical protein
MSQISTPFELLKPVFAPTAAGLVYGSSEHGLVASCATDDPVGMPAINTWLLNKIGLPWLATSRVPRSTKPNLPCIFAAICPNGRGYDFEHVLIGTEFPFALQQPEIDTQGALCVVGIRDWFPKMNTALPALITALRAEAAKQECDRLLLLTTPDQTIHLPSMLGVSGAYHPLVPGEDEDASVVIFTIPVPAK